MSDELSLITINMWGTSEPLGRRLELASRQLQKIAPDVVGMQEVRPMAGGRGGRTTADELADALGMHRVYEVAVSWDEGGGGHRGAGEEGLAILSRYPILEHRALRLPDARPREARILLSARVDHPAAPLWCHTTHLHYRLDDGVARERQVVAIDEAVRGTDDGGVQLLCGDFNAAPEHDEIRFLRGLTTLAHRRTHYQDAWLRCRPGEPGLTWSAENEQTRALRSLDIDRRIDYVFVTTRRKDGRGTLREARVVLTDRDEGVCASDHYGVLARVQVAPDPGDGSG